MCVDDNVLLDLCELYPETAERLKFLAYRRKHEFKKLLIQKNQSKVILPSQYKEEKTDRKQFDKIIKKLSKLKNNESFG